MSLFCIRYKLHLAITLLDKLQSDGALAGSSGGSLRAHPSRHGGWHLHLLARNLRLRWGLLFGLIPSRSSGCRCGAGHVLDWDALWFEQAGTSWCIDRDLVALHRHLGLLDGPLRLRRRNFRVHEGASLWVTDRLYVRIRWMNNLNWRHSASDIYWHSLAMSDWNLRNHITIGIKLVKHWIYRLDLVFCELLYFTLSINFFELDDAIYNSNKQFFTLCIHNSITKLRISIKRQCISWCWDIVIFRLSNLWWRLLNFCSFFLLGWSWR